MVGWSTWNYSTVDVVKNQTQFINELHLKHTYYDNKTEIIKRFLTFVQ